jgi:hypothetical protein
MISWIQVINAVEGFATAHLQVRKYGAEALEQLDQFATRDGLYPLLFLHPVEQVSQRDCVEVTFGAICLDRLNKNRDNSTLLKSDCALILHDLTRWLDDNFEVNYGNVIDYRNNDTVDYCAGAEVRITLTIEKVADCEIPFFGSPFPPAVPCSDATAVLENTQGAELSSTDIPSGSSAVIVAPDGSVTVENSQGVTVDSGAVASGGFNTFNVADSIVTLQNEIGTIQTVVNLPATDPLTLVALGSQVGNSDGSYNTIVPSGVGLNIPDSQINVNGNNEGNVVSVKTIDVNLTDGTNPVTPNDVTLVGNTLTIEVPAGGEWQRNPLWPQIPSTPDRAFIVWAVFEDEVVNGVSIRCITGTGQNIDWGDGSSVIGGAETETHSYDYATLTTPIIMHPTGRNYKPVLIEVDRNGISSTVLYINQTQVGANNMLELVDRFTDSTSCDYRISSNGGVNFPDSSKNAMLVERVELHRTRAGSALTGRFAQMYRCRVFDVPSNFITTADGSMFYDSFDAGVDLSYLNLGAATNQMFILSQISKIGNITCGNTNQAFALCQQLEEVGDITITGTTATEYVCKHKSIKKNRINHSSILR